VLAIGVSLYRDQALHKGVRFAARDADTMGQLFREQGARLYRPDNVHVRVLSDAQATGDAIRTALTELASRPRIRSPSRRQLHARDASRC
jgi:hypothetical protein